MCGAGWPEKGGIAMRTASHDVLIAGGGPVGLALALALARHVAGVRIGLVDRRAPSVARDSRAFAVSAGARRVFEALGVWDAMAEAANPIAHMRITDSGTSDIARPLFLSFDGDAAPGEPFAHMVPNGAMSAALIEAVGPLVEVVAPAEITGFDGEGPLARLVLADGRILSAPLVVAADGRQSLLRRLAGIGTVSWDYRQSGIVATIGHALDHENTAYEHFRPAGPFASLPLHDAEGRGLRSSLVWTEAPDAATRLCAMRAEELAAIIEAVMGSTLGKVTLEDAPQAFPLHLQIARSFVAPRLALVGDAAHVVHPIAGQGLNLGLKDVAALAETVVDVLRLGLDPGAEPALSRYQAWRRLDTALMAAVTDGMNRLFSNDLAPLRAVRDVGLGLVDRLAPLKTMMIGQAAGIGGGGPKLLRGRAI